MVKIKGASRVTIALIASIILTDGEYEASRNDLVDSDVLMDKLSAMISKILSMSLKIGIFKEVKSGLIFCK